jgi:hypothetical protein
MDFAWAMINKARILSLPVFQLRTLNKSSLPGRLRQILHPLPPPPHNMSFLLLYFFM